MNKENSLSEKIKQKYLIRQKKKMKEIELLLKFTTMKIMEIEPNATLLFGGMISYPLNNPKKDKNEYFISMGGNLQFTSIDMARFMTEITAFVGKYFATKKNLKN